jgi:peptide/nickel transport system substrate-binding protein
MSENRLARREFLHLSAMAAAGAALIACQPQTVVVKETVPVEVTKIVAGTKEVVTKEVIKEVTKEVTKVVEVEKVVTATPLPMPEQTEESPMLRKLVEAGSLPPLDERLPVDPRVLTPVDQTGEFGGTLRHVHTSPDMGHLKLTIAYDTPAVMNANFTEYIPNLLSKWEFANDGKTLVIYFRKGVKWSDGEPFTMDDLKFWWEDLAQEEAYQVIPVPWWLFDYKTGNQGQVEFLDDYTVSFSFDSPSWLLPGTLGSGFWEWEPMMKPKHYLQQFHPTYTPASTWDDFQNQDHWNYNPDYPVTHGWHVSSYTPGQRVVLERSPFYWKVDTDGNQLPYIDRFDSREVPNKELRLIQVAAGEYDMTVRGVADPKVYSILKEQESKGNYHVVLYFACGVVAPHYTVDQNYVDDEWMRGLLRDHRFLMALSHAIDRDQVNETLWDGLLDLSQATIGEQSWHFQSPAGQQIHDEWKHAYIEYDPDQAGALLDEIGLTNVDDEGFRTKPDGSKLEIVFDIADEGNAEGAVMLQKFWQAIGLRILLNSVYGTPQAEVRHVAGVWQIGGLTAMGEFDLFHYPDEVFPIRPYRAHPMVGQWYATGGKEGWAPEPGSPEAQLIAIYEQIMQEPDLEKGHALVHQAVRIHIDNGPFIGAAVGNARIPVVINNNLRNVLEYGITGPWAISCPGNLNPEQWFFSA